MTLTLHFHPLASFCHKVLVALYENETPFETLLVDLQSDRGRAQYAALWPVGKMPLLHDQARDKLVHETTIIIEYLSQHYPGPIALLPRDPERALDVRLFDRFYDLYVSEPMQKIVGDRLRNQGEHDRAGVEQARRSLHVAYGMIERDLQTRRWAAGDDFTMADCAAAPALFYAHKVEPLDAYPSALAYRERLLERPSYARVLREAEPYMQTFPTCDLHPDETT